MRNPRKVKKIDKKIKVFIPPSQKTPYAFLRKQKWGDECEERLTRRDVTKWACCRRDKPLTSSMSRVNKGITGMPVELFSISRRTKVLRSFFVCLFLVLLYIQQSTAQVDPKLTAKIKTALISKPWPIYVTYQQMVKGTVKSSVEKDLLTFTEDAVLSENLSAQGYSKDGSGYKVKIGPAGDTYIWESIMLHKNQKDIVMLKGELKNGVMTGVIIYQPEGAPAKTCNFTTIPHKISVINRAKRIL